MVVCELVYIDVVCEPKLNRLLGLAITMYCKEMYKAKKLSYWYGMKVASGDFSGIGILRNIMYILYATCKMYKPAQLILTLIFAPLGLLS